MKWNKDNFAEYVRRMAKPVIGLSDQVNDWRSDNFRNHLSQRGLPEINFALNHGVATFFGGLELGRFVFDPSDPYGERAFESYGLASLRVVTDTGVGFIVDAFQNLVELENMKYHGIGTGTTAEAASQTALVTELTTALNPDSTRATGTLTEGATANIFRTVATNNVDSTVAVTEHGVFSQAATGGGVMLDRSLFSAVNLASGDGLQTQYDLTITSGG